MYHQSCEKLNAEVVRVPPKLWKTKCRGGEMVDTPALGAGALWYVGSSPIFGKLQVSCDWDFFVLKNQIIHSYKNSLDYLLYIIIVYFVTHVKYLNMNCMDINI